MAIIAGVESAVKMHIRRGDDLDARDDRGFTPLMIAAARDKAGICRLLLAAGAEPGLTDQSGRDALAIALVAGAAESAHIIGEVLSSVKQENRIAKGEAANYSEIPSFTIEPLGDERTIETTEVGMAVLNVPSGEIEISTEDGTHTPIGIQDGVNNPGSTDSKQAQSAPVFEFPDSDMEENSFDLLAWEAEEDGPAPVGNDALAEAAVVLHRVISDHQPVDTSEDWGEFEVFLPEWAVPLPRVGDEENRIALRCLFLRAIREGSVPASVVEILSQGGDGSRNEEGENFLCSVLNELGAETDERFEIETPIIHSEETLTEEETVSEALAFMEDVASGHNDPLRHFAREVQRTRLLTAEDELFLGQEMEEGGVRALDALASWPDGVSRVLAAAELVKSGEKDVNWISTGRVADHSLEGDEAGREGEDENEADSSAPFFPAISDFLSTTEKITALFPQAGQGGLGEKSLREALAALALSRIFLLELTEDESLVAAGSQPFLRFANEVKRRERARERMIVANLRLVLSIAKRYMGSRLPFDDLIQEGNIGLMKAVDRYDWHLGFKFSTYATWWIRQQITRAIADNGLTIRVPVHVHETMYRISKEADEMERDSGKRPSEKALAEKLSISLPKVAALMRRMEDPLPIHMPDETGALPAEMIEDSSSPDPFVSVALSNLRKTLDRMLAELDPRSADVIVLRNGLDGGGSRTLEETGAVYGFTRERARQVESKALKKFLHPSRVDILRPWLDMDFSGVPERARDASPSPDCEECHGKGSSAEFIGPNTDKGLQFEEDEECGEFPVSGRLEATFAFSSDIHADDGRNREDGAVVGTRPAKMSDPLFLSSAENACSPTLDADLERDTENDH